MKQIKFLDCTLRDGGYINDWKYGKEHIKRTINSLEETNPEILELGFIKDEPYNEDRTVFNAPSQIAALIPNKKPDILYTAMIECVNPIPLEKLPPRNENDIDAIRVIVWKDMHDSNGNVVDALHMGYEYCKGIVEKGYQLFVQPARVDQYTDEEFINMINLFQPLNPKALYIVDSWGTMYADKLLRYLALADKTLNKDIAIGYHGHNNMMQAFANAIAFINADVDRTLILDASVYGIGRGAGNLNSEIIAKYLNENEGKSYRLSPFFDVYEDCVKDIYDEFKWGYMPAYFMTALHHCNPQYGTYYGIKHNLTSIEIDGVLGTITDEDKVMYSADKAQKYYENYINNHRK